MILGGHHNHQLRFSTLPLPFGSTPSFSSTPPSYQGGQGIKYTVEPTDPIQENKLQHPHLGGKANSGGEPHRCNEKALTPPLRFGVQL